MLSSFSEAIIDYVESHRKKDVLKLLLKKSPFEEVPMQKLVQQMIGINIAAHKFPFLLQYKQYHFPPKISLEQSSSQYTANYKQQYVSDGGSLIDLTGGMGIDTYFLSKEMTSSTYVDLDKALCESAEVNFKVLGVDIQVVNDSAENIVSKKIGSYDWIYIDPSRRVGGNKKTGIQNLEPNVVELQDHMIAMSEHILLKLSPMQDIVEAGKLLRYVRVIDVVALGEEVKELLVLQERDYVGDMEVKVTCLSKKGVDWQEAFPLEQLKYNLGAGPVGHYIYQPHPALVKSGMQDSFANRHDLWKFHANTQLYTSDVLKENWKGRIYAVKEILPLRKKLIQKAVTEKKANIISKNHPLSPSQIAKKIGFVEGGEHYLIACTQHDSQKIVVSCDRLR